MNNDNIDKAEIPDSETLNNALPVNTEDNNPTIKDKAENKSIDVGKALTLRLKNGLSYGDITKQFNVSRPAVYKRLKPFENFIKDPDSLNAYGENRAAILNSAEMTMIKEMVNGDKLEKASVNNIAYAYNTLFNARRLDQGESTANISHHLLSEKVSELDREEAILRAELEGN